MGGSAIGCTGGSSCDHVLNSRWSSVAGVLPVAGLAAGVYLATLAASLFIGRSTAAPERRLAWGAMLILAGAAAGSAVWFIILQKWIIGAWCPYCMATHLTGLALATLVIWRAPEQLRDPSVPQRLIGPAPTAALALVGFCLAGVMAICQVLFTPPPASRAGEARQNQAAIDPHAVPLVGSPDAPYVVTLLFDYQCPHCQQMHLMLDEVVRRYGGKLAFALCPTPMSSECNPYVAREADQFKDSCELARIGLAVWLAKRESFADFNRWMFSLESGDRWRPRTLNAARAKATELVGQSQFNAARANPWIDQYLQTCTQLFGDTGGNGVPKLVFRKHWVM